VDFASRVLSRPLEVCFQFASFSLKGYESLLVIELSNFSIITVFQTHRNPIEKSLISQVIVAFTAFKTAILTAFCQV